jgi:hypothetical protein
MTAWMTDAESNESKHKPTQNTATLPCLCYREKRGGKKEEKEGKKGTNSEFSRHWIIFYATEH